MLFSSLLDICWFLPAQLQILLSVKDTLILFQKKSPHVLLAGLFSACYGKTGAWLWLRPDQSMYPIPLVPVIDRNYHAICTRSKAQLQGVSWNYWERDCLSVQLINWEDIGLELLAPFLLPWGQVLLNNETNTKKSEWRWIRILRALFKHLDPAIPGASSLGLYSYIS